MNENTRKGDFVMQTDTGRMGVVENVSGSRDSVDVRMRDDEQLVTVTEEEWDEWQS